MTVTYERYKRDQRVLVLYGKHQGLAGTVLQVSRGVGYWYLVQIDGQTGTEWIHRLHLRGILE